MECKPRAFLISTLITTKRWFVLWKPSWEFSWCLPNVQRWALKTLQFINTTFRSKRCGVFQFREHLFGGIHCVERRAIVESTKDAWYLERYVTQKRQTRNFSSLLDLGARWKDVVVSSARWKDVVVSSARVIDFLRISASISIEISLLLAICLIVRTSFAKAKGVRGIETSLCTIERIAACLWEGGGGKMSHG